MKKRTASKVTAFDVAQAVGVSQQTVSLVVRNSPRITPETRERVLAAIETLGYRPNAAAAALRSARSSTLGFLLFRPGDEANETVAMTDVFRAQMLTAIMDRARASNHYVMIDTFADADHCLTLLEGKRIDGALIDHLVDESVLRVLVAHGAPVVLVGRDSDLAVSSVKADENNGCYVLGRHLLAQGHRRIAVVGVDTAHFSAIVVERLAGFRRALQSDGLVLADADIVGSDWSFEAGYAMGQHLLSRTDPPTAIFALAEQLAVGVLEAARAMGVRVPHDLAVVTTEDNPWVDHVQPRLTAVHVPMYEVGRRATDLLLARVEDPTLPPEHLVLPTTAIVRESSATALVPTVSDTAWSTEPLPRDEGGALPRNPHETYP